MTEANPGKDEAFVIQEQVSELSHEPLKVYHLSHDLRGPLNSILGFAELLLEGIEGPLNEIQTEDMAAIQQSAKNLLQLINAVVDLSKLENDRLNLTFAPVELGPIIEQVLATNVSNQVELVANVPDSLPPLWGDKDRVRQMILDLVNFVRKIKQEGQIELSAEPDEKNLTVRITASEILLPPGQLEELFDLVVKVDEAGRSELGRGGLILPLTRQLAQKHQGRVWAESEAETGTTFFLKLPLHQPA